VLFVGDDWAEVHHDVEIVDRAGRRLARARLPEGLEGMTRLHALIGECLPGEWAGVEPGEAAARVKVGIEIDRGRGWGRWWRPGTRCSRSTRCRWPGTGTALHLGRRERPVNRTTWRFLQLSATGADRGAYVLWP